MQTRDGRPRPDGLRDDEAARAGDGHELKTYDPKVESTAKTLRALAKQLEPPRHVWVMVPSGEITEDTVQKLLGILEPGDTIVDGGNSNFRDSQRRHKEARKAKISFVDAGVSGGIWGLEVGFCLMVGGDKAPVKRLRPRSSSRSRPRTASPTSAPSGAGHFTKMVHNGIEYGLMQAYAEGFELMHHSEFPLDLARSPGSGATARSSAPGCSSCSARRSRSRATTCDDIAPFVEDSGRRPLDDREAIDENVPAAGDHRGALRALRLAPAEIAFSAKVQCRAPEPVRRARRQGRSKQAKTEPHPR